METRHVRQAAMRGLLIAAGSGVLLWLAATPLQAIVPPGDNSNSPQANILPPRVNHALQDSRQQAAYAKGQFIVKFKSEGTHTLTECAHCWTVSNALASYTAST